MQSDQQPDRQPEQWQPPTQQPSQTPYVTPLQTEPPRPQPIISLAPDSQPAQVPEPSQPAVSVAAQPQPDPTPAPSVPSGQEPVRWQAHEYIRHDKNALWFVIFAVVVIVLIVAAVFLIKSITFAILIPVMAAALLVYTHRPPRVLDYTLSRQGLHINDHLYPFADFKSFGVIHDGHEYSVMLVPTKRFRPGVSVYFPEESGEAIVDMLAVRMPMQDLHLDLFDRVVRKLRL